MYGLSQSIDRLWGRREGKGEFQTGEGCLLPNPDSAQKLTDTGIGVDPILQLAWPFRVFFFMPDSCMCYDRDTLPPVAWAGGRVRRWGWLIGIPEICTVRCMGSTVSSVILQYIPWYTIAIKLWDRDFKNDEWAPPPACLPHVESVPQRYCPLKTF